MPQRRSLIVRSCKMSFSFLVIILGQHSFSVWFLFFSLGGLSPPGKYTELCFRNHYIISVYSLSNDSIEIFFIFSHKFALK